MEAKEDADESLKAALSKAASTSQQFDMEVVRREALERSMDLLKEQVEQEKKDWVFRYKEDLEKRRMEWEFERDTLLTMIQKDCNAAFESRKSINSAPRSSPARPSPLRAGLKASAEKDTGYLSHLTVETGVLGPPSTIRMSPARSATVISPSAFSDIDSVLRETEDLIQSIL